MKNIIFLAFLITLINTFPACKKVYYNYMQLVLSWPQQFCSETICDSLWRSKWDKKSFLIHGMWPSSTDLSYLQCQIDYQYDKYCYSPYSFDLSKFSWYEKQELEKYWPDLKSNNIWGYEWKKHGTCFLQIIKNEEESPLSTKQIFKRYFIETIKKVKDLNISLSPRKINSKKELANAIGLHESQFYAICKSDNQLDEIRICYDIYYEPGLQQIINCPASSDRNLCKFPMYIK